MATPSGPHLFEEMNSRIKTVARTTCIGVALSVAALYAVGCSRATPQLSPVNGESDATRRLEVDVSVSMPPGARFTYVLREIGNRVDGYVVDELNHDKREPLCGRCSPASSSRRIRPRAIRRPRMRWWRVWSSC